MSDIRLKEVIRQEYIRCAADPNHFFKKYCYIQNPVQGRILFNTYPFQEKLISLLHENPYSIILKSRQLGISTLSAGYALWLMLFHKDKNVLCIATKEAVAKNMVTKTRFMYDNLPSWLKIPADEKNKLSLRLTNGSQIKAVSAAADSGRSEAVSLLIIDEAAFIDGIDEIWASSQQTLASGGGAIVLSTPNGVGNWFHKTWVKAEEGLNQFLPIRLPWDVHPDRDQVWRKKQDELLGDPRLAAQECDCLFASSGDTVFVPEHIEWVSNTIEEPIERRGLDKNLWIWYPADYSREYAVIADVARGDGKDSSACHVIDIESNTQVAEYKGLMPPKEYGFFLTALATEYNNALLIVENSNMGWSTLDAIQERGYRNLYHSSRGEVNNVESYFSRVDGNSNLVPGFSTNLRTRPLIINKFREYVSDKSIIIKSKRLLEEMKVFIWKNGRPEAQTGYNDDLIMSMSIGMYLRDTALKYQQYSIDLSKAALNNMGSSAHTYTGAYNNRVQNPYEYKTNNGNMDLRWLL